MSGNTSKVKARRLAREAQARANEVRVQQERANVEDAATVMVALSKLAEVDVWETERLAQVRDNVRVEANRRRSDCRTEAAAAIVRIQERGRTLATVAELTGRGLGELRTLLRYKPKPTVPAPANDPGTDAPISIRSIANGRPSAVEGAVDAATATGAAGPTFAGS